MSSKHLFASADGLVIKGLKGLVALKPELSLDEEHRIVFNPSHDPKKVSLVSGGGSGHEPGMAGYVGKGMLSASVSGDIFASPSTKQITAGLNSVPSQEGIICIVLNYTGDMLHFGLTTEKYNSSGRGRAANIVVADDVAVGRKAGGLVGRRGLASIVLLSKILGAVAEEGIRFDKTLRIGNATTAKLVTVAASLDHCSVPGRNLHAKLADDECEVGLGLHNEPGFRRVSPIPSPSDLIAHQLKLLLDPNDPDRSFVPFTSTSTTILLINNTGGMSTLETNAIVDEALVQLSATYQIHPIRVFASDYMTSLNMPGWSITLLNVTDAAKEAGVDEKEFLKWVDWPVETIAWRGGSHQGLKVRDRKEQLVAGVKIEEENAIDDKGNLQIDPERFEKMVKAGCLRVIDAEAKLTEWDTIVGDGDCGETCSRGAQVVIKLLDSGLARQKSLASTLYTITSTLEDTCGGTLGAVVAIYLAAFTAQIRISTSKENDAKAWSQITSGALKSLQSHTPARVGDRTVMDVLIPFVETLEKTNDFKQAVEVARTAAEGTKDLKPKLGRSTYVDMKGKEGIPDPGAFALYELLRGLLDGYVENA
jgi:dihydroxyacetone kinase